MKRALALIFVSLALFGAGCANRKDTDQLSSAVFEEQQRSEEYVEWQESRVMEDAEDVEKKLKERWKDEDEKYSDSSAPMTIGYIPVIPFEDRLIAGNPYSIEMRRSTLDDFIEKADNQEEKDKIVAMDQAHPDWHANHVFYAAMGSLAEGMSSDSVEASYGKPDKKLIRSEYSIWWYWNGKDSYEKTRDLLVFGQKGALLFFELDR